MKAIDLFSGAGGMTVGLKQAGFNVIGAIEINDTAHETYTINHPEVQCLKTDIKAVDPIKWMKDLNLNQGDLDLLAGCPPCQGFSTLRTRKKTNSVDDDRNNLIWDYLRFVEAFLPKSLMMENVPALVKDERMTHLLQRLKELGYILEADSLGVEDASLYGVPQRRKRMILKVSRLGKIQAVPIDDKVTVRDCFKAAGLANVGQSGDPLHDFKAKRTPKVMELIEAIPKDGGSRNQLPEHLILECHKQKPNQFADVYGRMRWDDVAPTITGGCISPSKGRFLHPEENREISLREAALLQTFPKDYKFSFSSGRQGIALMIGNALPPEFIRRQADIIKKHLMI